MIAQVSASASLLPKIWNMVMLKCYDAKMNGRVCLSPGRSLIWLAIGIGMVPEYLALCHQSVADVGEVWPLSSSDEKFLFITRIQREKSTYASHFTFLRLIAWLLFWSLCPCRSPNKLCRFRTRESGVLRLVIPDFSSPTLNPIPSRLTPLTAQNLFLVPPRNWIATLFHS